MVTDMVLFSFPPKKFFFCCCWLFGCTIEIILREMVKIILIKWIENLNLNEYNLFFQLFCLGNVQGGLVFYFFCPGFYRPREAIWGSNRGKTPFSPFLRERGGGKSQNRKRELGLGERAKNKNREEWIGLKASEEIGPDLL